MSALPEINLTMLTLVKEAGELELGLARLPLAAPQDHEVVVKVLAAPINPSDLGLMIGGADASTARSSMRDGFPLLLMDVPPPGMRAMATRVGEALPIGNEGSGIVVATGSAPEALALMGKTVAMFGGSMFAEYRTLPAQMCMVLPEGTDPKHGASCFVNPLTALSFVENAKMDGHTAIVHTAAASNLGQMLNRICLADGIPLINIVRNAAQVAMLRGQGAKHVLDSSAEGFLDALTEALVETGATVCFDAIGGGKLGSQIMACMEQAAVKRMASYSRYGSDTFKQLFIYGALDMAPTVLTRSFGFQWSVSGWLLTPFMGKAGAETMQKMRARVLGELTTTFASHYSHEVTLEQALDLDTMHAYNAKRTGEKYLIRPFAG